jgi:2-amino-4-hydroxy-6-hydroxymethyldihydropteridine diphosphokinase
MIRAQSRLFSTPAFPPGSGPDYVNAALAVATDLDPEALLGRLHAIEEAFGRRRALRWGPRSLDLDLIAVDDAILPDRATFDAWAALPLAEQMTRAPDRLILPHPRLHERAFVLVPLLDVAPDWRHPVIGRSVREMCAALPAELREEARPLESALVNPGRKS